MRITQQTIETKLNREISSLLRENITYDEFLKDTMLIIGAIRSGIPYSLFDLIQDYKMEKFPFDNRIFQ